MKRQILFILSLFILCAGSARAQQTFIALNGGQSRPALYWESDYGVTNVSSAASAWLPVVGAITLSQGTAGNRPTITTNAFGTTTGLTFNGTTNLLSYTGQAITQTGAASLSVVFKTGSSVTGPFVLVSQADSAATNNYWELGIGSDGKLYVSSNAGGTTLTIQGSTVLSASTVYNAILCYDGTDFYLLLNGVEENPLVITSIGAFAWIGRVSAGSPVFAVGATVLSSGTARFFNGVIGGVYFWNKDLTQ